MSWRLGVQLLLPTEPASLWGVARWDEANWSLLSWWDLSLYVRGMEWVRGALDFDGRPEPGEARITLTNRGRPFSPVDPTSSFQGLVTTDTLGQIVNYWMGPGSIMRIVAHDPDDPTDAGYVPQFTGIVASWPQVDRALGVESSVTVTVWETMSALANVNENAVAAEGDDDIVFQRVRRLADAAGWQFGYIDATAGAFDSFLLQPTTMAQPRTADIYLAADSVGATARSDRSGALIVYGSEAPLAGPLSSLTLASLPSSSATPIDPEGLTLANDNEALINHVEYARAGSTVQTATDQASIYQRRAKYTHSRSDLINKSDSLTLQLAQDLVAARGNLTQRVAAVTVNALHGDSALEFLVSADVHNVIDTLELASGDPEHKLVFSNVRIDSMEHRVLPRVAGERQRWTCTYRLGRADGPTLEAIA